MNASDSTASARAEARAASQRQFGAHAANYASSHVHAKGASLGRLVELVDAQPEWQALDIATAAGHVALALASRVRSVVASDVTAEMLEVARASATERSITNVTFEYADAHELPFEDQTFDLVTCRIAPHHFADPARFVAETARVLAPGGVFGLVDNIAPEDPTTAKWCDDFERRRDPSHLRCLPIGEWLDLIDEAGFVDTTVETMGKRMVFHSWADNMSVPDDTRSELLADLTAATEDVQAWLRPEFGPEPAFILTEGIFIARQQR